MERIELNVNPSTVDQEEIKEEEKEEDELNTSMGDHNNFDVEFHENVMSTGPGKQALV